jgi:hypothetical protein
VFAEYDPDLKNSILSGGFNRLPCPACRQGVPVENRFLYRDEKNRLWVWVCKMGEEPKRDELAKELIEKNTFIEGHFLDGMDDYRKFLVFGRDGLIELLLKEDEELKRKEGRSLKRNPALRWIVEGDREPGYLFLRGEKINISMPLKISDAHGSRSADTEGKKRWLKHYSQGLNIHNPYSSFLNKDSDRNGTRSGSESRRGIRKTNSKISRNRGRIAGSTPKDSRPGSRRDGPFSMG